MSQSSYFVALVYAFLKERNINTDDLPVPEAIEIFNNLQKNGKIRRVPKETLSNSGWARFYSKLGEKEIGLDTEPFHLRWRASIYMSSELMSVQM